MELHPSNFRHSSDKLTYTLLGLTVVTIPVSGFLEEVPDIVPIGFGIGAIGSIIFSAIRENR